MQLLASLSNDPKKAVSFLLVIVVELGWSKEFVLRSIFEFFFQQLISVFWIVLTILFSSTFAQLQQSDQSVYYSVLLSKDSLAGGSARTRFSSMFKRSLTRDSALLKWDLVRLGGLSCHQ